MPKLTKTTIFLITAFYFFSLSCFSAEPEELTHAKIYPTGTNAFDTQSCDNAEDATCESQDHLSSGVGVCFSGGGSRAYSLTLGQMAALEELGLESDIQRIVAVSGGAWAIIPYYMAKKHHNYTKILPIAALLSDLYAKNDPNDNNPANIDHMPTYNLGRAPQLLGHERWANGWIFPRLGSALLSFAIPPNWQSDFANQYFQYFPILR